MGLHRALFSPIFSAGFPCRTPRRSDLNLVPWKRNFLNPMSEAITGLIPKPLWQHFASISAIPRASKKEQKIAAHIMALASANELSAQRDSTGNIVVRKPASKGRESAPMIALQSHIDMVCEKNKHVDHDFSKDGIQLIRSNGYVKANGTTLGSDNGIGVSAALCIMLDKTIVHGPMEFLFTVDEETGLTGANGLQPGFLKSRILINLDSEEEGALYVGCSGGRDTILTVPVTRAQAPQGFVPLRLIISGLRGGHSGLDINSGRASAVKLLARSLWHITRTNDIRLSHIQGGSMRNAIAREAEAVLYIRSERLKGFRDAVDTLQDIFKREFATHEPHLLLDVQKPSVAGDVFTEETQIRLLNLLYVLPHGVIAMSADLPGLVETSTNLASIETDDRSVVIGTLQRSAMKTSLDQVVNTVGIIGTLAGATSVSTKGYPGWKPDMNSHVLDVTKRAYRDLFSAEPAIKAIHAGLECGIIGEKYPGMDMVSFGPTIEGAHSPDERVEISTVQKFYELLVAVLDKLSTTTGTA